MHLISVGVYLALNCVGVEFFGISDHDATKGLLKFELNHLHKFGYFIKYGFLYARPFVRCFGQFEESIPANLAVYWNSMSQHKRGIDKTGSNQLTVQRPHAPLSVVTINMALQVIQEDKLLVFL